MKHKIEFRTTISPTPYFFRRVHFLAASLRALGGEIADHEIVVSVGGGEAGDNYYRSQPWSCKYPIVWRHVSLESYARLGYRATNLDRSAHMSRADYVMMVDADVIFLRDFSDLLAELERTPAICGVMAHASPFLRPPVMVGIFAERIRDNDSPDVYWDLLAEHFGIAPMKMEYEYSGWGIMSRDPMHRFAPAYFNGGMVLGNSELMDRMCELYPDAEGAINEVMETYFCPQLARTLACHKAGIACRSLPLRYNFPNDPGFDAAFPEEAANISILHYLRHDIVHRDRDFSDVAGVERLVARTDLSGSNEDLRRKVAELREIVLEEEAG